MDSDVPATSTTTTNADWQFRSDLKSWPDFNSVRTIGTQRLFSGPYVSAAHSLGEAVCLRLLDLVEQPMRQID